MWSALAGGEAGRLARAAALSLAACCLGLGLAACRAGAEQRALEQEWAWLQETQGSLAAQRAELAQLQATAAAPGAAPELAQQAAQLEGELTDRAEEFALRLVDFLNEDPMIQGARPSERQLAAVRMKSAEDLILAREWIDEGGDYKQAIDIYETALALDPDNEELRTALATAQAARFMTPERFALARRGMSQNEVRALLGQPNRSHIREVPERGIVAWFYPTSERGDAAGVWFETDETSGEARASQLKYDAIQREEAPATGS